MFSISCYFIFLLLKNALVYVDWLSDLTVKHNSFFEKENRSQSTIGAVPMIECKLGAHKHLKPRRREEDHLLTTNSVGQESFKLRTNPSWHVDKTTRWVDLRPVISNGAKNSGIKADFPPVLTAADSGCCGIGSAIFGIVLYFYLLLLCSNVSKFFFSIFKCFSYLKEKIKKRLFFRSSRAFCSNLFAQFYFENQVPGISTLPSK